MMQEQVALCVIGGGNMAQAIVRGGLDRGVLVPDQLVVAEPDEAKWSLWQGWGVEVRADAALALDVPARLSGEWQVLLAVKPQVFGAVALAVGAGLAGSRVVMSIMAGVPSDRIRNAIGNDARVVRLMPNTPARVARGITAMCLGAGAHAGDETFARELFEAVGAVEQVDESLMDAFTAIAGSGPAYVFYLAEAMVRGGVAVGFDETAATRIVRATLEGAGALLAATDESAPALRAAVTSKGGTTAAAVAVMDECGVMDAIVRAVVAARDRGREMGVQGPQPPNHEGTT
jgi:pyrroline-5-carboxylate reductase